MAFDSLMDRLQHAFKNIRNKGKVTEADIREAMREIRLALLEADVNYKVVKSFIASVSEKAAGAHVVDSITPAQQIIKIVNDELVALMGGTNAKIAFSSSPPTVIMMAGLQGAGKTTTSAKLAMQLKKQGKRPLLVAADIYRPAAITQLEVVGRQIDVPVFSKGTECPPVDIAKQAVEHAKKHGNDVVIIDTAGRLHINEELMQELQAVKECVNPTEILLVIDSMTGQDAVNAAQQFDQMMAITGVILTKLDGDTRGGAALSVREVTGKPIKFAGMGEKLSDLEPFYPDRMASRILGMGDVVSLVEKAQEVFDQKQSEALEKKLRQNQFTFEEFLEQIKQMKKMGPLSQIIGMLPGVNTKALQNQQVDDSQMGRVEAIILSMTPEERRKPVIINSGRKQRIAKGSGTRIQDVNALLKQFEAMQKMFKQFSGNKGMQKKINRMGLPF